MLTQDTLAILSSVDCELDMEVNTATWASVRQLWCCATKHSSSVWWQTESEAAPLHGRRHYHCLTIYSTPTSHTAHPTAYRG